MIEYEAHRRRPFHVRAFSLGMPPAALPDEHPLKWPALLRDLECRTTLAEPPADIIKVIRQHQFLHPDAGDETLVKRFDVLLRENQRRLNQP